MSGVGITYLWAGKTFPSSIRLEGRRGDYKVYVPEQTCNLIEDGDSLYCSNCGGVAEEQSWAYWSYCPNCRAKVERRDE